MEKGKLYKEGLSNWNTKNYGEVTEREAWERNCKTVCNWNVFAPPPARTLVHRLEGVPFRKGGAHVIIAPLKSVFLSRRFCLIVLHSKREAFLLNEDFFFCELNFHRLSFKWQHGGRELHMQMGVGGVLFLPQIFAVWVLSSSQRFTKEKERKKSDQMIILFPCNLYFYLPHWALHNTQRAKVW